MEQAPNALTKGSVVKALVTFTLPFLLANVLQSLYGAVDLFVVGQYCDAQSVAAVSTGTQVTQIVTSLVTGLTLGGTILIGKYTGMERWDKVKTAIGTTLSIFALVALALTALMLLFEAPLLTLLNTPAESFEATMEYVAICAWGNFFICGYNSLSAVLRGYGDSVRPMYFVGVACVVNILLDFLFVKYVGLGAGGTALATVLSQGVSMAIGIGYLKRKRFLFDFKPASFRIDPAMAKELARVGIPISFQELMVRISFLYLTAVMNHCGVYAAAVVGIGSKYDVFSMLSATSIANALAAITAQNMGAGKPERARKSLWYGLSFALLAACAFWTWAQVSPETMIALFSEDSGVIAAGVPFFRACSYDYIMVAFVFCLNGYLNGRAKTLWTMVSCTFGALCLRIPLVWFVSGHFSQDLGMLGTVAPDTGYRYYSTRQLECLNTIRYLRVLEMPLEQIREFLQNREVEKIQEMLQQQKEVVAQKQRALEIVQRKIENRLRQIQDALASELDVIRQVDMPARRIAWLHDTLPPKTYLDLELSIRQLEQPAQESVVFLGKVGVGISRARLEEGTYTEYDRVFLLLDQEDVYQGKEEALPPERCLTVRFRGSHREAEGYYRRLMEYIRRERLEILGPSKEITMIDDGMTSDTEKFVTEIQIPVGPSEGGDRISKKRERK